MNIVDLAILKKMVAGGGGSGTDNYNDLSNLPQINGETLAGNKTAANLGLQDALTFDSAPTEDSTNPVESGGVYTALAGKQDNLTFDDDPTENSTNPVKSGGVYSALAGKQDNLTFDGVYNASTNKAATESTVTNAIAGLDVSAFSVDADETISSISETDGKISVTKQDIAIASNQVVAMTGYTKPSSAPATPAIQQGDTANTAFGKLEFKADTNQTNILYAINTGVKNSFADLLGLDGTVTADSNGLKVTLVENGGWHVYGTMHSQVSTDLSILGSYSTYDVIYTRPTDELYIASAKTTGTVPSGAQIHFFNKSPEVDNVVELPSNETYLNRNTYTWIMVRIPATSGNIDFYIYPMIRHHSISNNTYQPPALPNSDLTYLEAEDRAALAEEIDAGAKNKLDCNVSTLIPLNTYGSWSGSTYSINSGTTSFVVNSNLTITASKSDTGTARSMTFANYTDGSVLNGMVISGGTSNVTIIVQKNGGNYETYATSEGSGALISGIAANTAVRIVASIASAVTCSNVVIKPMLATKAAFGVSNKFVPFGNDPFYQIPINHNMIYRGRNLGATLTDAQHTALSSGNFTDLYLGDYWTKTVTIPAGTYTGGDGQEVTVPAQTNITLKAVIADFDTFYAGYASTYAGINTHHAAVIVTGFSNVVWNKTNSTAGGYVASLIHKWLVGSALPQIETWFGSAKVLSHQKLLTNAITGDAASGWAWSSQKISLLSENQMYGSKVWGNSKAANGGYEPGEAFKHLNVFNHIDANLLFGNKNIWLRDIASAVRAACLINFGKADFNDASNASIAPAALILLS